MNTYRADFPLLRAVPGERMSVYLDNAATTQKPLCVLEALRRYYEQLNANIHRGTHYLSRIATDAHEEARQVLADFLGAASEREVIFTPGCTQGINLVAQVLRTANLLRE
ncbi:MAG: aminotransferase class V-fold PLP-dependent enzyme, partial [Akkermansia sp.]